MTDSSAPFAPSVLARFWSKVNKNALGGCWLWTPPVNRWGYGQFTAKSRFQAHQFAYLITHGALPEGLEIDHTCHNQDAQCAGGVTCLHRRCVNPDHLEAVTHRKNMLRGKTITAQAASQTHCSQGHPFDLVNTRMEPGGRRRCRKCHVAAVARSRARKRARAAGQP